jgi:NADPH:quinone reductase-like Zn-dependent oxidoreductase
VQIAKSFGADMTGICSTKNVDMVRSIGADHVVDYTQEDFTKSGQRYDLFFDCVGNHSLSARRGVLTPRGDIYRGRRAEQSVDDRSYGPCDHSACGCHGS